MSLSLDRINISHKGEDDIQSIDNNFQAIENEINSHLADNATAHGINTKADKQQQAWQTMTLVNGWVNYTGTARYYKDNFGRVWCEGYIDSGNRVHFTTLPAGYRPDRTIFRPYADSRTLNISISPEGYLEFAEVPAGRVFFEFSFRAAN